METQTITNEIRETIENIYEYIKTNSQTNKDYTEYLKTMGIYNLAESKLKEYYTPYIFERSLPECEKTPLALFNETKSTPISKAMINNFTSVFEIKKVLKNGFEAYNIINEKSYQLNVTAKMTDYRGYGIGQYLVARVFQFKEEYYIIELLGHLASNKQEEVMRYAMAKILQEPYLVYEDNEEKHNLIKENIKSMYNKFIEAFDTDELITTNTYTDDIIGQYNDFVENGTTINIKDKLVLPKTLQYFEVKDLENDYDNFVEKSLSGFSSHKKEYDTGIIYDKEYGLYVIPFYKTISTILEQNSLDNIEKAKECIEHFITSGTISANIIERLNNKYPNLIELANKVMETNLTLSEMLLKYKHEYIAHKIYSQTTILYNSKIFNNTLGIVAEHQNKSDIDYSNVKRNDPCPCGSGKKYKNCCLNK